MISQYICERYPQLLPSAHRDTIMELLDQLHAISFGTLSFRPEDRRSEGLIEAVKQILAQPHISDEYRKALEVKLK